VESLVLSHFDYLVLGIIALSGLIAFFRGFIQETLSLLLWIIAFAASMFLNVYLDPYFIDYIDSLKSEEFLQSFLFLLELSFWEAC
jgi:uncharacterized membrane protein required for colicin V production